MLFSIITPVYNAAEKLEATIASVLAQRQDLYEYIIVDGGSTDGTGDVLRRQPASALQWISEPDRGIYDAMNKGIARASGRYLYFLGAGDLLEPDALAKAAALLPPGELAFVYGNVRLAGTGALHDGPWSRLKFTRGNITHQAIFYGREIFARHGGYNLRYPLWADYVFNLQCFGDPQIPKLYVPLVIATYEGGGASVTRTDSALEADRAALIRRHLGFVPFLFYLAERRLPEPVKRGRYTAVQALRRLLAFLRRGASC